MSTFGYKFVPHAVGLAALVWFSACSSAPTSENASDETVATTEPEFVTQNAATDLESNLLVRVFLGPQHVVEFYEPSPGKILVSEAAAVPELPVFAFGSDEANKQPSALASFKALLPGATVPDVLLAADQRRVACADPAAKLEARCTATPQHAAPLVIRLQPLASSLRSPAAIISPPKIMSDPEATPASNGGSIQPAAGDFIKKSGGSCDGTWFQSASSGGRAFCPSSGYFTWCNLDWYNGAYADSGSWTDETWATTCADIGNITMKVSGSGGGGTWSVPQGSWRQWWKHCNLSCGCFPFCTHCCDFKTRYDVLDASGDRFQFGGLFQRFD